MTVEIRVKTGLESNRLSITPARGELLVTTDTRKIYVGDGATAGGTAIGASCELAADETAMLASKATAGDLVFRTDIGHVFVLAGNDPSVKANWVDTDLTSKADVGLGNVQNYGISDSVTDDVSEQYASSRAVYLANERAKQAEQAAIAYADTVKNDLLGGAPDAALDTLLELGNAITDNDSQIATIITELSKKVNKTTFDEFVARTDNPHGVTKTQVGLGNVQNYGISDAIDEDVANQYASSRAVKTAYDLAAMARAESLDSQKLEGQTLAEVLAQARNGLASNADLQAHLNDETNPHNVTKAQVGLGKVENFSVAEILASDAVTMAATDKSARIATTQFVENKLVNDKYLKDGDILDGGTF